MPATIQALLAARLDRLPAEQREVLERGAVKGEVFHRGAVQALALNDQPGRLEPQLAGLVRQELIRPHPPTFRGDEAFRFHHILIRDAAYDGLPKATRSSLHERFVGWLNEGSSAPAELDEIAGWHLEQTVRYRRELGREVDPALRIRAAEHLHATGRRALDRRDVPAAKKLHERALALAPEGDTRQVRIAADLAEVLVEAGELVRADELLAEIEHHPDVGPIAALTRLQWMLSVSGADATRAINSQLPGILDELARTGDQRGLARAHLVAGDLPWIKGPRGRSSASLHSMRAGPATTAYGNGR